MPVPAGADTDGDGIFLNGLHVVLLANGFCLDGLSLGGDAHHILGDFCDLILVALTDQGNEVAHPLLIDGLALGGQLQQGFQGTDGLVRHLLVCR